MSVHAYTTHKYWWQAALLTVAAGVSRPAHCLGCLAASGHYAAAKLPADGFGWELEHGVTAEGMQMRA